MRLLRGNSFTEIEGAPDWWLRNVERHLSVPIELHERGEKAKKDDRFGTIWWHEGAWYGSLLLDRRTAAGLTPHLTALAAHYGLDCALHDTRTVPTPRGPWGGVYGVWRPYQDDAHRALLAAGSGIVDAPPRSGKTRMAARVIDEIGLPALYIAPSVAIVRQTAAVLGKFFGDDVITRLDGESFDRDLTRPIVVATYASAVRLSPEWYATRGVLIIDEFHHGASQTVHRINALASSIYHRFCFTGTHFRTGGDMMAMEAVCSQVVYKVTLSQLVPEYLAIPRIVFVRHDAKRLKTKLDWRGAYQAGIVDSEERNKQVVYLATRLSDAGVPTLVLTRRRAHADALGAAIPDSVVVKGGENSLTSRAIHDFVAGKYRVLVGTTVLGEGVDVPNAGGLIYASAGSDGVTMMQSYFRPLTAYPGKRCGWIYDFVDHHNRLLLRNSEERDTFARRCLGDGAIATNPLGA